MFPFFSKDFRGLEEKKQGKEEDQGTYPPFGSPRLKVPKNLSEVFTEDGCMPFAGQIRAQRLFKG